MRRAGDRILACSLYLGRDSHLHAGPPNPLSSPHILHLQPIPSAISTLPPTPICRKLPLHPLSSNRGPCAMPCSAAPPPHTRLRSRNPINFQDFSIQTISNQELAPTATRQTHSNEGFTAKVRVGVGGTHKGQKTYPPPPPRNILYLFAHLDPISINKSTTYKIGTSEIQPGNSRIFPGFSRINRPSPSFLLGQKAAPWSLTPIRWPFSESGAHQNPAPKQTARLPRAPSRDCAASGRFLSIPVFLLQRHSVQLRLVLHDLLQRLVRRIG